MTNGSTTDGKKEACKTYVEQTKLLVALASAFLFAPPGLIGLVKDKDAALVSYWQIGQLVGAECLFVASVLAGYVVLGSLAGSQDAGDFDVFRPATRGWSLAQFGFYLCGLIVFVAIAVSLVT